MLKNHQIQPSLFLEFTPYEPDQFAQSVIGKVVGISKSDMVHIKVDSDDYIIPLNSCKPVKLNDNYILSFGFKVAKTNLIPETTYSIEIGGSKYFINKDKALGYCLYIANPIASRLDYIKPIPFVNDLQSAIIFLSEKKLEYKPIIPHMF